LSSPQVPLPLLPSAPRISKKAWYAAARRPLKEDDVTSVPFTVSSS
jgi:hypothetical protein